MKIKIQELRQVIEEELLHKLVVEYVDLATDEMKLSVAAKPGMKKDNSEEDSDNEDEIKDLSELRGLIKRLIREFDINVARKQHSELVAQIRAINTQTSEAEFEDIQSRIAGFGQISMAMAEKLLQVFNQKREKVAGAFSHLPSRTPMGRRPAAPMPSAKRPQRVA